MSNADPAAPQLAAPELAAPEYYAAYAGLVVFPHSSTELSSTTLCPACFSPLSAVVCSRCGLDLSHPAAAHLAALSAQAASVLAERLEIIGRIRYETDAAVRTTAATEVAPAAAAALPAPAPAVPSTVPRATSPMPVAPTIEAPRRVPGRSSVQILLLIVGVTLLSIAAVFFLVYAFITYGLVVRSVIIAAITVASFVVASLLKRRKLRSTAEGIAVFSSLLLYLDAFAVRANDLFGAQHANGLAYWGLTLVASSVVLLAWNRQSGLRVPTLVGFAAVAPGLGLAAGGLASAAEPSAARAFLVAIVIAAGGLLHPVAARWSARADRAVAERVILLLTTVVALLVAVPSAFGLAPKVAAAPALGLALCGVVAIAHVVLASRSRNPAVTAAVAVIASIGALALGLVGLATPTRLGDLPSLVFWAPLSAVPLALALEVLLRRSTYPYWRSVARAATITAVVTGGAALVAPVAIAIGNVASSANVSHASWTIGALAKVGSRSAIVNESILVLVILGVIAGVLWNAGRFRRPATTAWLTLAMIVIAVPELVTNAAIVGTWLVLGLLAVVALAALGARPETADSQAGGAVSARSVTSRLEFIGLPLMCFAIVTSALGYAASWSSDQLWFYGTLSALATLLVARRATASPIVRAGLLGVSTIVALIGSAALARQLTPPDINDFAAIFDSLAAVSLVAAVIVVASITVPRLAIIERRVLFWITLPTASLGALTTRLRSEYNAVVDPGVHYPLSAVVVCVITSAVVLAAIATILLDGGRRARLHIETISAAVLLAPVTLLSADSLVGLFGSNALLVSLEVPLTCVVVAAAGLVAALLRRHERSALRLASDAGIAVVALAWGVAWVPRHSQGTPWLSLVVLGIAALLVAISPDGLFGSRSLRRWLGWIALALATAGLWSRLGGQSVVSLEPYVLPLAGALLAIAGILDRVARSRDPQPRSAPIIALASLLVGVIPIGLEGASGSVVRPAIVAFVCVALLAGGIIARPRSAAQRDYLAVASFVGAVGVLVVGVGRSVADRVAGAPALDLWFAGAVLVTIGAAFALSRRTASDVAVYDAAVSDAALSRPTSATGPFSARLTRAARTRAAQVGIAVLIVAIAAVESPLLASNGPEAAPYGRAREIVVVMVLSGIALAIDVASQWYRDLASRALGWFALAAAGIIVVSGTLATSSPGLRAFSPIEVGTAPIALALLVAGGVRMSRSAEARSWPTLGTGLVLLLAPSLLASLVPDSERPLWRLVALGVVAIALVVIGVTQRLQAPFLLGSIVAIIHGVATFAQQIRVVYEAVPWWLWLGVGGVLIILLAARYEHRIRNLRTAALKIGSLR